MKSESWKKALSHVTIRGFYHTIITLVGGAPFEVAGFIGNCCSVKG